MVLNTLDIDTESFSEKQQIELNGLNNLIKALNSRKIPIELARKIEAKIIFLNNLQENQKDNVQQTKAVKEEILKWLEKDLKLIPQNYYAGIWNALGMAVFGLPIGAVLFAITGKAAFISLGLPIGLAIGRRYGISLDKKAEVEDRVLKFSE